MPTKRARIGFTGILGCLVLAVPPVRADDGAGTGLSAYLTTTGAPALYAVTSSNVFDGVAKLVINGNIGCSGSLVGGGAYILTAAHCVANDSTVPTASTVNATFAAAAGEPIVTVAAAQSSIYLPPGWNGNFRDGDDLALIKLSAPLTGVTSYGIVADTGLGLGAAVKLAGYGYSGTGAAGYTAGTFGILHVGTNTFDSLWNASVVEDSPFRFDFDDGTVPHNSSGSRIPTVDEAMIAPGDSGGPSFVNIAGALYIVGVHSFGGSFGTPIDLDRVLNASFGELGGDTNVPLYAAWITGIVAAPVPEPQTWMMLLAGLCIVAVGARAMRRCQATARAYPGYAAVKV